MKISEIIESDRMSTSKQMTLIICYDNVYINSLKLLKNISLIRKEQLDISAGTATYLADMCRDIIIDIDNLPELTVPFPKHIRSGLIGAYNYLLMSNANLE